MSKLLQLRGGTTSQHTSFTGSVREVTVDTDKDTLVVHDGSTAGGFPLPRTKANIDALNINADLLDGQHGAYYTGYTDTAVANIVDSSPAALNTLNELAAALGDDANFATTTATSIGTKLSKSGGAMTGAITTNSTFDGRDVAADGATLDGLGTASASAATDFVAVAGDSMTGNLNFGDNDKAVFGAGSDLQIYHDGSHSYIRDTGAGGLKIDASELYISNAASNESMINAVSNGAVTLFHNNASKLATNSNGITVTGTINGGDCRGEIFYMGRDTNDYFASETDKFNWFLGGNEDMRLRNNGDLHVEGNVIAYSTTISDERLKTDIVKIDGALDKVGQLNGYTFTYTADGKKSAGVIAQEVQKVLPSAITESKLPLKMGDDDETEYMTVQYDQLMGLLIEAVKELKAEVAELKGK